jgi:hypothetical protein
MVDDGFKCVVKIPNPAGPHCKSNGTKSFVTAGRNTSSDAAQKARD